MGAAGWEGGGGVEEGGDARGEGVGYDTGSAHGSQTMRPAPLCL